MVQLKRSELFGSDDVKKWLPDFQIEDAKTMCPPFMGSNYNRGGLIILPINPGGGNVTSDIREGGDNLLYPLVHEFKGLKNNVPEFYWDTFVPNFIDIKKSYSIYTKGISDILNASGTSLNDICYFNFLPFRGRGNSYPHSKRDMAEIIPRCIEYYVNLH